MTTKTPEPSALVPLVGRIRELSSFHAALQTVAGGEPLILQVIGETGIGRTRLLREFYALVEQAGAAGLLARPAAQDETPLDPLRHGRYSGPLPVFRETLPRPTERSDHFARLLRALAADARTRPVWLLIDDLHAADEATCVFVERLAAAIHHGNLTGARIGVVLGLLAGAETDGLRKRLSAQDRRGAMVRMHLPPLDGPDVARWLEARFGAVPEEGLRNVLAAASRGNPLLLTELSAYLQRAGLIEVTARNVRRAAGSDDDGLPVPADLTALLRDKIGALSGDCRRAMTLGAFIGNEFQIGALADLLRQPRPRLEQIVDEAAAASLVERGDGDTAGFKHAAARELLYEQPDRRRREGNHRMICERLFRDLGAGADEHCLTITHHLLRAGTRAEPDLVLRFAPRAAELAFRHHSYYLAGRYYEAAAVAGKRALPVEEQAALYCRAGESFHRWSDAGRSTNCLEEAARLYRQCGSPAGLAQALQGLLRNRIAFGEGGPGLAEVADQLQNLLGSLPEQAAELKVRVHDSLASYYHSVARYDVAEAYAQRAMTIASGSEDPNLRCIPVTSLALAQMEQLRLADAKATWLAGISYDRAASATRYEGLHLQRLPVALYCMGEVQEAARYNQESYRHNESIGNTAELCLNLTVDTMISNLRGDFDAAIGTAREAMEIMAATRYLWSAPSLIAGLAYALAMQGRFDEAASVIDHLSTEGLTFENTGPYRSTAARLRQLLHAHRDAGAMAPPSSGDDRRGVRGVRVGSLSRLCSEAELALLQGRPERLTGIHDALEFVHRRGAALALGWCTSIPRSLAVSTALRIGMARAAGLFAEAEKLAERVNAPLEAGRVALYRGLAALLSEDGDLEQAHRDLGNALDCFERHDAAALARKTREALSRCVDRRATH